MKIKVEDSMGMLKFVGELVLMIKPMKLMRI